MADILRAIGLSHRFPDGALGLDAVDFHVSEGECLLLAGRNGSGKTLLARHLVGLATPTRGEILFKGRPLRDSIPLLRRSVGFVFQDTDSQILGQTVVEDVAFGPSNLGFNRKEIADRVRASLEISGLSGKEERRPETLSGGEKRRLAIAGVLAMEPECLILDEPFANLDFESVREVVRICETLTRTGLTVMVVTHELEKIFALAGRMVVLDGGEKVFDRPPQEAEPDFFFTHGLACPYTDHWPWAIRRTRR
ncbi:MAG: cbiO3 [Spirochaetes bacterium]|nr:MAG: cbiO3 [Spirochaetota bacterium]